MISIPNITLSNGVKIPAIGLGTWQAAAGECKEAVKYAIDCGYRHIDCAYIYKNEIEVGHGIVAKIKDGTVKREDLFITSKLWNTSHHTDAVVPACKKSLNNLGLDYLDLYLIHWPFAYKDDVDYIDTWKGMEECVKLGLTKCIGVSNFNSEQIKRLLSNAIIKPVMNQIEVHPNLNQNKLVSFCKELNIAITGYSPLGSPTRVWAKPGDPVLDLNDPKLVNIGKKYNKTSAQIILRFLVEIGVIPIPKSVNRDRIKMNLNIFDFKLDQEDISILQSFNCNGRICPAEENMNHKYYPFNIDF